MLRAAAVRCNVPSGARGCSSVGENKARESSGFSFEYHPCALTVHLFDEAMGAAEITRIGGELFDRSRRDAAV